MSIIRIVSPGIGISVGVSGNGSLLSMSAFLLCCTLYCSDKHPESMTRVECELKQELE